MPELRAEARRAHAELPAELQLARRAVVAGDRDVDDGVALVVFEERAQLLDDPRRVLELGRVDRQPQRLGRRARRRAGAGDLLAVGFEALSLLDDELRLAPLLVVDSAAH